MPAIHRVQRRSSTRQNEQDSARLYTPDSPLTAPNRSRPTSPSGLRYYSGQESHTAPQSSSPFITSTALHPTAFIRPLQLRAPYTTPPIITETRTESHICVMETGVPEHACQICPNPDCDCERSPKDIGEPYKERLREDQLRYFLLVSAVNSFTQLIYTKLKDRAGPKGRVVVHIFAPGGKCTNGLDGDKALMEELKKVKPHLVICPFLTSKVPDVVFNRYLTLVVHPGPPGDVGPSSLDWTLLGDSGEEEDAALAMSVIREGGSKRRSHWGCVVFQANDDIDKGPVWAWEEYVLPTGPITKGQLYQNYHSPAAWRCIDTAIDEVIWACNAKEKEWSAELGGADVELHPCHWASLSPSPHCATHPVTPRPYLDPSFSGFQGGPLRHRPIIAVKDRKLDMATWTAKQIYRFVAAFDSQPGAQMPAPSTHSKTNLFVYGAHLHEGPVPENLYRDQGWYTYDSVPDGTALATRDGAVFFKTKSDFDRPVGVWITHGRVIRPLGRPLEAKVPLTTALIRSGHAKALENASDWPLDFTQHHQGTWQEVYVNTKEELGQLFQHVYWDFYNGAFSTEACRLLLSVLEWATDKERGNVRCLVLMGGQYFSNGVALNTIEDRTSQEIEMGIPEDQQRGAAEETWSNINAIDDIVEFLAGDTHPERSAFLYHRQTLCEKGIVTVAALRGNAAAGGVALSAACDVVMVTDNVILNPAYRAMGLHGSELHSWSYTERCGEAAAAKLLTDMLPMSANAAYDVGLVDACIVRQGSLPKSKCPDPEYENEVALRMLSMTPCRAAPWVIFKRDMETNEYVRKHHPIYLTLAEMIPNKMSYFTWIRENYYLPPLVHYRYEELSQMLLDCFHPVRSKRYHDRRRAFIRKIKCGKTPTRYQYGVAQEDRDEEELPEFDDAPKHRRGDEWDWVHETRPKSLVTSAWTQVQLFNPTGFIDIVPEEFGPPGPYRLVRSRIIRSFQHEVYGKALKRELAKWIEICPGYWRCKFYVHDRSGRPLPPRDGGGQAKIANKDKDKENDPKEENKENEHKENGHKENGHKENGQEGENCKEKETDAEMKHNPLPPIVQRPLDDQMWRDLSESQRGRRRPRITPPPNNEEAALPFSRSASPEPAEQSSEWAALCVPNRSPEVEVPGEGAVLFAGPTQTASIPRQTRRLSQIAGRTFNV